MANRKVVETGTEARQGRTGRPILIVLIAGLALSWDSLARSGNLGGVDRRSGGKHCNPARPNQFINTAGGAQYGACCLGAK